MTAESSDHQFAIPAPADWHEERAHLRDTYLDWVSNRLPTAGVKHHWPITADHCFIRIVLDQLFQDCWYRHLDRRYRAYRQLDNQQLRRAIELCERMENEGAATVARFNQESLSWRATMPRAERYRRSRRRRKPTSD